MSAAVTNAGVKLTPVRCQQVVLDPLNMTCSTLSVSSGNIVTEMCVIAGAGAPFVPQSNNSK